MSNWYNQPPSRPLDFLYFLFPWGHYAQWFLCLGNLPSIFSFPQVISSFLSPLTSRQTSCIDQSPIGSHVHWLFILCPSFESTLVCDYLTEISFHLDNTTITEGVCSPLCCWWLTKVVSPREVLSWHWFSECVNSNK